MSDLRSWCSTAEIRLLAQQREIVRVEIVPDEDLARPRHRLKGFNDCTIAAAD